MSDNGAWQWDYFISRAGKDAAFAIWLGQLISAQGGTCALQDEHLGHQDFIDTMDSGLKSGARMVALLSPAYMERENCFAEITTALTGDPLNRLQKLVLLRLEPCTPGGVLADIAYTDLLDERRQTDARPLALKVLLALGFDTPHLEGLPPPPEGTLSQLAQQLLHPQVQAVSGFTGREPELAELEEALWRMDGRAALTDAPAAAAKGLGGVGKSALAKEYAWRNRAHYQGIWWMRAQLRATLADDLIELGARFIPGLKEMPDRDRAARRTLDWIEQAGFEKPWLLVYDNVEEPGHIDGLTPRTGAHVIVTTRWSVWGKAAAPVTVRVLPADVAASFLLERTGHGDREGAERLAAALGHLPLALDHAAGYIRRSGIDFATYEALAADLLRKAPQGVEYDTPVLATFSLAIDKASEDCPEAQKLMGLGAFLAPDRIPLSLFTDDVLGEIARNEAMAALQEVSLASLEPLDDGSPGLSLHRVVQAMMRGRLKEMGEHENAAALATELVADAFPGPDPGPDDVRTWPACARLAPHAIAVLEHAPDSGNGSDKTALLLNQTAAYLLAKAAYAEAEPLMRRALVIGEASYGPGDPRVARSLDNLAGLLQAAGRPDEAEALYRRALAIDEASLGPDHPSLAVRLNNLTRLQDLTEAEPLIRPHVDIFEKPEPDAGDPHPHYEATLDDLAELETAMRGSVTPDSEDGAPGSDPAGLTPKPAAPQPHKRGFMGGLFPRRI